MSRFGVLLGFDESLARAQMANLFEAMGSGCAVNRVVQVGRLTAAGRGTSGGIETDHPCSIAGHTLVGDVTLSGRERLRQRLDAGREASDHELVLRAYLRWSDECVLHLEGDFAFVVSNGHDLFAARDALGVKPLYYAGHADRLVVASEAESVARVTRCGLNEQRIESTSGDPCH